MHLADPTRQQQRVNADPEVRLAARYWTATLSPDSSSGALCVEIEDGRVTGCRAGDAGQPATLTLLARDAGGAHFLAATIDTTETPRYIRTGEYDWSSTAAMGQALATAVPGATFGTMPGLGHFPMRANPARVREHILPVLGEIRARHAD